MSISLDSEVSRAAIAKRDLVVDLARVACVLLVVVIHLLMIGVGIGADGAIIASRPLEAQPWFAAATWAGQIMPLFFALGRFTAHTAWRSLERRGGDQVDFVRGRVLRRARPAMPLFLLSSVALAAATLAGVDPACSTRSRRESAVRSGSSGRSCSHSRSPRQWRICTRSHPPERAAPKSPRPQRLD